MKVWDGWARKEMHRTLNEQRNALAQSVGDSVIKCKCANTGCIADKHLPHKTSPSCLLLTYACTSYDLTK